MADVQQNITFPNVRSPHVKMELYTVVLSVTTLSVAMIFGTGGNIILLFSVIVSRLVKRLRYGLIALLLFASLLFDLIYCPTEIYHLISHYHSTNSELLASPSIKFAAPSMYLFLITGITCVLILISVYNLCVLTDKFKCLYRYVLSAFCVVLSLAIMLGPSISYGVMSKSTEGSDSMQSYHILNSDSFIFRVIIYSLWIFLAVLVLVGMISFILVTKHTIKRQTRDESSVYSEPPTPERLNIPTLLIKGTDDASNADNDKDDCDEELEEEEDEIQILPLRNSLLNKNDSHSTKEDNTSTLGDLPSPSRTKNHHLGVNMAAYLGRRRHTIGQIGTTGLEHLEKAKNYNYVRKFSVDIQALQAQLENPKIHAEFPFRSDTELQKSGQNSDKKDLTLIQRAHTPTIDTRQMQNESSDSKTKSDSNHDVRTEVEEKEQTSNVQDSSHETLSPPVITLSETTADECHDTPDTSTMDKSSSFIKLSTLLVTTFIFCLLPMFITETVRDHLSKNAYINILTCTLALSVIQTIIYPHIVFCMDNLVHSSVHKLLRSAHAHAMHICYNRQEVPTSEQPEVNVTQV
ncbi:hypothetical protein FSP39_019995 [Pinctada imbricata]|uniref:G-protein coupled receptors family 1 profile domain-containing protein n=1 Tax=Pinctada imbricata TaxID=66713 RepID=A0AA88Y937_PINIB|nr:hypothetical protein FSP39_019995 [Pinctada imbricata]